MKKNAVILILTFVSMFFYQCESDIDIDLPPTKNQVVIDGVIEYGKFARVTVSKAIPYFSEFSLTPAGISDLFYTDAIVVLTDGVNVDTLTFAVDPQYFPPVFYQGTNPLLKGKEDVLYKLTVYANGDTLTSSTWMPQPVPLDSLYWKPAYNGDPNQDSLGFGWLKIQEPDTSGNLYCMYAKRQGYRYYMYTMSIDDRLGNGANVTMQFFRPSPNTFFYTDTISSKDGIYYKRGDTISVQINSMNPATFNYITSLNSAAGSIGNPFAGTVFVKSNVKGGIGGFVGLGQVEYTFVAGQ